MSGGVVLRSALCSRRAPHTVFPAPVPSTLRYRSRTSAFPPHYGSNASGGEGEERRRVRATHLEWVEERLSDRDRAIMSSLAQVRLASGSQLERLHFTELAMPSRPVVRRRVLARLVGWHVLTTFERRIGGVRAGSAGLVYALDTAGHRLINTQATTRRPKLPGERFWRHLLDITELYVQLVESQRHGNLALTAFATEPACWWRDSYGVWIKPDAFCKLSSSGVEDAWWVEVDRATESLPTLRRKLLMYVEFARLGQNGPGGIIPRVLVTVPTQVRKRAVQGLIDRLPGPASELMRVVEFEEATEALKRYLHE